MSIGVEIQKWKAWHKVLFGLCFAVFGAVLFAGPDGLGVSYRTFREISFVGMFAIAPGVYVVLRSGVKGRTAEFQGFAMSLMYLGYAFYAGSHGWSESTVVQQRILAFSAFVLYALLTLGLAASGRVALTERTAMEARIAELERRFAANGQ